MRLYSTKNVKSFIHVSTNVIANKQVFKLESGEVIRSTNATILQGEHTVLLASIIKYLIFGTYHI